MGFGEAPWMEVPVTFGYSFIYFKSDWEEPLFD